MSEPASARCTSFSSLRWPADSRSADFSSSDAERSTIVSEPAVRICDGRGGDAPSKASIEISVSESFSWSPIATAVGAASARPLSSVVLREPRSSTIQRSPSRKNRACCRERKRSDSTRSAREERPITSASLSQTWSNGSPTGGVTRS